MKASVEIIKPKLPPAERAIRIGVQRAINDVAFKVRAAEIDALRTSFDRPTPYITNAPFVRRATRETLQAEVELRYPGGKGIEPSKVLRAEIEGGPRRQKRAEAALSRIGLLPRGWAMVPTDKAPKDAYGNVPGSFIVQLLSYFSAFAEQGYRANMTAAGRKRLAKFGRSERGFKTINGAVYFVSRGRGQYFGREQHLAAGIWKRSGIHGSTVVPIFLFVKMPSYTKRFDFAKVAQQVLQRELQPALDRMVVEELRRLKGSR